ncbi:bifunctional ligase/repressor BirA [Clostridiales bacterium]|nr:bifunctional ligase/repressor BirA [Clostridiales bacterium]
MELKDSILSELMTSEFVSGENMAKKYFVSRNGIWKAVKKLREEGWDIEAVSNKGYCLKEKINKISEGAIKTRLNSQWEFTILKETDSTNNYAKEQASQNNSLKQAVIAEKQTQGRGRMGRAFYSPDGNGLYMSAIIRMKTDISLSPLITSYTAVAVANAVERLSGQETYIKWVNDIYMNGKKLCGILTEAVFDMEGGSIDYVVIGIGVNVLGTDFPMEIDAVATSIERETGKKLSRNDLAAEILNELDNIESGIKSREYMKIYRDKSNVLGKKIKVIYGEQVYDAVAIGINDDAALVADTENGIKIFNSGEVSIKL